MAVAAAMTAMPAAAVTAGSVLQHTYQGELCDVGIGVPHPVYRYSKPLFMGVTL